nr:hypothetical protein CFP56_53533 [Quercus suber]
MQNFQSFSFKSGAAVSLTTQTGLLASPSSVSLAKQASLTIHHSDLSSRLPDLCRSPAARLRQRRLLLAKQLASPPPMSLAKQASLTILQSELSTRPPHLRRSPATHLFSNPNTARLRQHCLLLALPSPMSLAKQASLTIRHNDLSTHPPCLCRSPVACLYHSPSSSPLFRPQCCSPPPTSLATR